ncbi:isochorismatase family protein [Pontibacillus yanchengensis]|uniref:Isochorismatase family protein n=2 Tax=Pontibacillus yanchengensis TaxID=462910 RepID=A0ACC7VHV9_9BACI|nr:isochorismatase family cysteine hydrolase [Pontibacillus yanchengensis]MYL34402.1 isochorismatase family protein [Pontibacillus yanchengensis]MYL54210.1 isochorismatase family protein [Pontibacillus yanchengensis]
MAHPKHTAIIIIDLINDFKFKHGQQLFKQTENILPNILHLKSYAKKHNHPIIYVNDHYKLWQADLKRIYLKCRNNQNQHMLDQIMPNESEEEYFLIKPKHSAFHQTALQALLSELHVHHLILTGIAGNICVLFSANDAYMREYDISVPSDGIASNDPKDNEYALTMMKNVLGANITPIREF